MSAGEQVWRNPWLQAKLLTFRRRWTANDAAHKDALIIFKELGDALSGYSEDTMNMAAWMGHLDVVQWLHANRREGCTINAMLWAAGNGHLDCVEWLHANIPAMQDRDVLDNALTRAERAGHIDIRDCIRGWLQNKRPRR